MTPINIEQDVRHFNNTNIIQSLDDNTLFFIDEYTIKTDSALAYIKFKQLSKLYKSKFINFEKMISIIDKMNNQLLLADFDKLTNITPTKLFNDYGKRRN